MKVTKNSLCRATKHEVTQAGMSEVLSATQQDLCSHLRSIVRTDVGRQAFKRHDIGHGPDDTDGVNPRGPHGWPGT